MKIKLRALREQKGWSQQETAFQAGLSIGAIQSIELGRALPSLRSAYQIKQAFGCSCIDEILECSI